ncbi:hypothetical protein HRED_06742 [Candidatus Haloredivivus sp. G17]|nr:hypothetical protein HRED_06742 [Candidatus Haloredivivus sp. G17]
MLLSHSSFMKNGKGPDREKPIIDSPYSLIRDLRPLYFVILHYISQLVEPDA